MVRFVKRTRIAATPPASDFAVLEIYYTMKARGWKSEAHFMNTLDGEDLAIAH